VSNITSNSVAGLTPEMRLVASAALRPWSSQVAAWHADLTRLAGQVTDWREVVRLVSRHQLDGLAYGALCDLPRAAGVPPQLLEDLAAGAKRVRLTALLQQGEAQRIAAAFQHAGVPAVHLKGAPLSERLYGDALLRHCVDIDVLVPPAMLTQAGVVLQRLGFVGDAPVPAQRGFKARWQRRAYHHCMLRNQRNVLLELHWRLGTYSETQTDRLVAQAGSTQGLGVLPQAVELAYLIAHGTNHYWARLKWLSDIQQALLRTTPEIWHDVMAECTAVGARHAVEVTRCVLAEVFATPGLELPGTAPVGGRHRRSARYALYRMQAPLAVEPGVHAVLAKTRYRLDCASSHHKLVMLLRCADRARRLAWWGVENTPPGSLSDLPPKSSLYEPPL
jgi:hypothetical protein